MKNNIKNKFRNHYKKYASTYDQLRDQRSLVTIRNATCQINFVLDQLDQFDEIVEVGCGTGKFSIPLAKSGKNVLAIDSSKEMLLIAKKKAIKENVSERIKFVVGDIENLPFNTASRKAVLSIAVLRHFEDEKPALSELTRILGSGGILITDYMSIWFFKPYDIFRYLLGYRAVKGRQWFTNYYRSLKYYKYNLEPSGLQIVNKKGFVLLPTVVTEKLHIGAIVESLEKVANIGGIIFLVSKKSI